MTTPNTDLTLRIGHDELVIRKRYETLSIANDVLIGVWFLVGSFMFFSDALMFAGTCLFVLGSVEMLIRPVIRLVRSVHLTRIQQASPPPSQPPSAPSETSLDF